MHNPCQHIPWFYQRQKHASESKFVPFGILLIRFFGPMLTPPMLEQFYWSHSSWEFTNSFLLLKVNNVLTPVPTFLLKLCFNEPVQHHNELACILVATTFSEPWRWHRWKWATYRLQSQLDQSWLSRWKPKKIGNHGTTGLTFCFFLKFKTHFPIPTFSWPCAVINHDAHDHKNDVFHRHSYHCLCHHDHHYIYFCGTPPFARDGQMAYNCKTPSSQGMGSIKKGIRLIKFSTTENHCTRH